MESYLISLDTNKFIGKKRKRKEVDEISNVRDWNETLEEKEERDKESGEEQTPGERMYDVLLDALKECILPDGTICFRTLVGKIDLVVFCEMLQQISDENVNANAVMMMIIDKFVDEFNIHSRGKRRKTRTISGLRNPNGNNNDDTIITGNRRIRRTNRHRRASLVKSEASKKK